tara:strand:+ start:495 stop:1322 length:828 start_codon:yes stop_codon:yes gene_type:complete
MASAAKKADVKSLTLSNSPQPANLPPPPTPMNTDRARNVKNFDAGVGGPLPEGMQKSDAPDPITQSPTPSKLPPPGKAPPPLSALGGSMKSMLPPKKAPPGLPSSNSSGGGSSHLTPELSATVSFDKEEKMATEDKEKKGKSEKRRSQIGIMFSKLGSKEKEKEDVQEEPMVFSRPKSNTVNGQMPEFRKVPVNLATLQEEAAREKEKEKEKEKAGKNLGPSSSTSSETVKPDAVVSEPVPMTPRSLSVASNIGRELEGRSVVEEEDVVCTWRGL